MKSRFVSKCRAPSIAFALLALTLPASAQEVAPPKPDAVPAPPGSPESDETRRIEDARAHFEAGVALFDEQAWDAALAEFLTSRARYPTRKNTKNAAICLRKLHRFDEALDMLE